MYELSFVAKYLTPRWKQLSASIISSIAVAVIAAVVWLIVVFFSVANGLTSSWIEKLIALTAPVRITPTQAYYDSYYYLVDSHSSSSNYSAKSIAEKLHASETDPYDPMADEELPADWPPPDRNGAGELRDPVKEAFATLASLRGFAGLSVSDFETTMATLQLDPAADPSAPHLSAQSLFVGSLDLDNRWLLKALQLPSAAEWTRLKEQFASRGEPGLWRQLEGWYRDAANHRLTEMPASDQLGEGILLPKLFRDAGVAIGSGGYLSYYSASATSVQEQWQRIFIAGFYDPGLIPLGGKYLLANKATVTQIHGSYPRDASTVSNGINVRLDDQQAVDSLKNAIEVAFREREIAPYWHVETFRDYEFTRDIIQQLQSEKHLFTLLATIIIAVACSNIVSMLIILVNDKKGEIGILRAMGASSVSIAAIFGLCGMSMGVLGSILGIIAAVITLQHIQSIVDLISSVQGYEMFNPLFYGETLPTELSFEALTFVTAATALISLVAGIVPAVKASLLKPSAILKTE